MYNNQQLISEYMSCEVHGNQTDFRFPVVFLDCTYTLICNKWCNIFRKKLGDFSVVNFAEIFDFYRNSARQNAGVKHDAKQCIGLLGNRLRFSIGEP
jgi:hypothetical protein